MFQKSQSMLQDPQVLKELGRPGIVIPERSSSISTYLSRIQEIHAVQVVGDLATPALVLWVLSYLTYTWWNPPDLSRSNHRICPYTFLLPFMILPCPSFRPIPLPLLISGTSLLWWLSRIFDMWINWPSNFFLEQTLEVATKLNRIIMSISVVESW